MPKQSNQGQNQPQKGQPRKENLREVSPSQASYRITIDPSVVGVPQNLLAWYRERNVTMLANSKRFATEYQEHIDQTKQNILATATRAVENVPAGQSKTALLFGVGNCMDILLEQLAQQFDSLTLVELDRNSVEQAVKKLLERIFGFLHDLLQIRGLFILPILSSNCIRVNREKVANGGFFLRNKYWKKGFLRILLSCLIYFPRVIGIGIIPPKRQMQPRIISLFVSSPMH